MATRQLEPADAGTTQFGSAAERRHVVAGKLAAPPLRPGIVDRPELVDSLVSAPHAPVVLVSAPAGYGKTTLLMLWQQREQRPFAWLSVGRADNDPVMFVAGVLAALDPILQLGGAIAGSLNAPAPPIEDVVLPELVDAWSASQQPFVFVLDDVHLVTEMRCHKIIDYLSHRLPAGCQLTLATRSDPALPLATLRAHGRLLEVRAADLALSQPEAAALLAAAGVRLSDDQVDRLVDRTEGWPAALYLAAFSLRDRKSVV